MGVKVRERPDKGWYVLIDWKGQRKAKSFGKDKRQAQAFAHKLAARLKWAEASGEPLALTQPDQQMPTVKAYLEDWLSTYAKPHCKPSTYRGYKRSVEHHLVPTFGDRPLQLLKREDVKRLIAKLTEQGRDRGTIQNHLVPLKAAYN
jgi:integrase